MVVADGSKAELVVTDKDGNETRELIHNFNGTNGIVQGVHNTDESIEVYELALTMHLM